MTEDRLAELMVKQADGLASAAEEEELMDHLATHPEERQALELELAAHVSLGRVTDAWAQRLVADAREDGWMDSVFTRTERGLGLALVVAGTAVLTGFGLWEIFLDPEAPLWVKAGTALLFAGLAVLSASVVRWKWQQGQDPYDEVIR